MFTTNGAGAGSFGDSEFLTIVNPASISNLTLNVEVRGAATDTNYFAVQVGGQWYAATSYQLPSSGALAYPNFTNAALVLTNSANVWSPVSIDASLKFITIGSPGSPPDFTQPLTGIGIVELCNTNVLTGTPGYNYNQIVINQGDFPAAPATNTAAAVSPLGVYAGGGVTFAPSFSGTPTLVFRWQTNGVNIGSGANLANANGTHYLGAQTTILTITNASANDALSGITNFSVVATNFFGKATNSGIALNIITPPPELLYAELFPFAGSDGANSLPGVGWVTAAAAGSTFGIFTQPGNSFGSTVGGGTVFEYSPGTSTNAYYTTITNDVGLSGLPFPAIDPASYPAITLQCGFGLGSGNLTSITAYWAVQMRDPVAGTNWYSSVSPINILNVGGFPTNQYAFSIVATNWNNLTIAGNVVTIGSQASGALTGKITGAGLVFVHTAASDMNFENFEIVTNPVTILPPVIGANYPIDVSVPSGGGASLGVATVSGSQPFTYSWKTNGVTVVNGGRVSGATNATLTIANLSSADNGMQIIAFVTNSAGGDESDTFLATPTTLTVTNGPVGQIYLDDFPFVGPVTANYPIESVGWSEAVSGTPFPVFRRGTAQTINQGDGAVFAFSANAATNVYYTTTTTDTNQIGLPFPNINLASYPSLNFSVDIAPNSASSTNVTAYLTVQLNGSNWYVAANPLLGPNVASNSVYSTYTMAFSPAAANWENLAVTPGTGGTIGSTAAGNLKGVMTGAGLVFVTVGTGGNFNFDNFQITDIGVVGGINVGPQAGGNVNLSWVGNPAVKLQSSPGLSAPNWQDVPNTYGLYSLPVPVSGSQQLFYRLKTQ